MSNPYDTDENQELTMHSRIFPAMWKLFQFPDNRVDKYTASKACHCDPKTAQRILSHLHLEHHIHIVDWIFVGNSAVRIPVYAVATSGDEDDMPRPKAATADRTKYNRNRRKDPDVREKEAADKRNKRAMESSKKQFDSNGCSMWKSILDTVS